MPDLKAGTVQITGLADLEKKLESFTDRIAKNILAGAIRAGAAVIQKEAREKAPVSGDFHFLGKGNKRVLIAPGHLRKSVRIRLAPRKQRDVPITYWVYVSRRAWYWKFVEFGTSKMSARSFMRTAFDLKKTEALEKVREYLAARIQKEASK